MIYNCDDLTFRFLNASQIDHDDGKVEVEGRAFGAISYKLCGDGYFELQDGKKITVGRGDVLYIPAYTSYKVEYSSCKSIVIHIMDSSYTESEVIRTVNSAEIELSFRKIKTLFNDSASHNLIKACIYEMLDKIMKDKEMNISGSRFSYVFDYFDNNFSDPAFSVETAGESLHLSQSSLRRAFASHLGLSPVQYLTQLRMKRAVELLMNSELSIKEIALLCGYDDEKYFSRVFKKRYGYAPSCFLRKRSE